MSKIHNYQLTNEIIEFLKNIHIRFYLLSFLILIRVNGSAQDVRISTLSEDIQIRKDTSFTRNVSVYIKKSNDYMAYPIFYDNKLEELSEISLNVKKGNRFKTVKDPVIREDDVNIDYITSKKIKSILIPPDVEAKICYTITCNELMYFSDLRFFSYDEADTLKYQIVVPEKFRLLYDIINKDSLDYLSIDSVKSDGLMKWFIKVVPVKVKPDPLMYFGIYKNMKGPLMRTIVVPATYKHREAEYLKDWYLRKASSSIRFDSVTIHKIDELTAGISDPLEITDTLYKYVKKNFKYVAIEIGMGAFIPSNVNEVFLNKQGDCKDLSNFLNEALNYKGIKSYIALAATYDHISDCDFPSLSSANHEICVAYLNNKPVLLDPTDPIHIPQTTVESIQEHSIFIIKPDSGEFYKINRLSPQQNVIRYEIALKADSSQKSLEGEFKAVYQGISGNFLRRTFIDLNNDELNKVGNKHYESVFGNQSITDLKINMSRNSVETEGKLSVKGKIFNDADNRYLFIDFLPRIIEQVDRETMLEGIFLGNTIDKKVKLRIVTDKTFEAFSPIEHTFSKKGVSLKLRITNPYDSVIECDYEFILDYIYIEKDNLDIINEALKTFKKITNEPIILKNKR